MTKKQNTQGQDISRISENVREAVKQVTSSVVYMKNLNKSLYPIIEANKQFVEQIKKMGNFSSSFSQLRKTVNKSVLNYQYFITEVVKKIIDFSKFAERVKQLRDEEKKVLLETGWIICPSLMEIPYPALRHVVVKYNKGDKGKSLALLMKKFYGSNNNWKYLGKTIESWEKHKLFTKQRMNIIRDSLWAHQNKKYTLSIPALLPIMEGIATNYCKLKKLQIPESKTTQKAKETMKLLESQGEKYTAEILLGFIENQLYVHTSKFKTSKNKKLLNRHGILHGYYSGYSDTTRSLKCFMILDVLSLLTV